MSKEEIKAVKENQLKRTIDYQGMIINYHEDQTVGNCMDLGFGTEKSKKIIDIMRERGINYMSRKSLEKYRNL